MSQVLSPEEVSALLSGIKSGDLELDHEQPIVLHDARPFDFSSQERVQGGSWPVLDQVQDRFARALRGALANALRRPLQVRLLANQTLKFGEFLKATPFPSSLHVFKLEPFKGLAVCVMEGKLAFALINHFFGGNGGGATTVAREFTPIEQRIIRTVIDLALQEYARAWQPVEALKISHAGSETNPQYVNVVPGSESVIAVEYEIDLEGSGGKLKFCLPLSMLEPIKDRLKNNFRTSDSISRDAAWTRRLSEQLHAVDLELRVDLGAAEITGRQLLNLKCGDIVTLNSELNTPLKIYVEDIPKYQGCLGSYHGNHAIKIDHALQAKGESSHGRKPNGRN